MGLYTSYGLFFALSGHIRIYPNLLKSEALEPRYRSFNASRIVENFL